MIFEFKLRLKLTEGRVKVLLQSRFINLYNHVKFYSYKANLVIFIFPTFNELPLVKPLCLDR